MGDGGAEGDDGACPGGAHYEGVVGGDKQTAVGLVQVEGGGGGPFYVDEGLGGGWGDGGDCDELEGGEGGGCCYCGVGWGGSLREGEGEVMGCGCHFDVFYMWVVLPMVEVVLCLGVRSRLLVKDWKMKVCCDIDRCVLVICGIQRTKLPDIYVVHASSQYMYLYTAFYRRIILSFQLPITVKPRT